MLALSASLAAAVALLSTHRSRAGTAHTVTIGVPDDTGGLAVHALVHARSFEAAPVAVGGLEAFSIKDCCAATSEWALSTDALDLAVLCPDAAERLIEKDARFRVLGPCVLGSEALVVRSGMVPTKIGVMQKRGDQIRRIRERFGAGCAITPMLAPGLPYAYLRKAVDGVVLDILKAVALEGDLLPVPGNGTDPVTYVLVVRKDFEASPRFGPFLQAYARTVADLADPEVLRRSIEAFTGAPWTEKEREAWKRLKVRLVSPPEAGS